MRRGTHLEFKLTLVTQPGLDQAQAPGAALKSGGPTNTAWGRLCLHPPPQHSARHAALRDREFTRPRSKRLPAERSGGRGNSLGHSIRGTGLQVPSCHSLDVGPLRDPFLGFLCFITCQMGGATSHSGSKVGTMCNKCHPCAGCAREGARRRVAHCGRTATRESAVGLRAD